jgi:putative phosphoesterase
MRIAIVSDTHDNMANFGKAIDWLNQQNIKLMLHCGDICTKETLEESQKKFKGKIEFVRGNGDFHLDNIPDTLEVDLGDPLSQNAVAKQVKGAIVHYPDLAKKLAESGKYHIVFYGHTHRPWEETVGNCRLVNPGELSGQRYKPCFALYDTEQDKLELKILENI